MALADGLVGYWSPWLGSSGYRLLGRTGRGNHGTLTNMDAGTDWVGATVRGRSGYALDFDGSNDYVSFGNPSVVTSGRPLLVATWFRTTLNAQRAILAKSLAGVAANRFWLTTEVNSVGVNGELSGAGVAATFTTAYNDGNWHQLAGLYDGSTLSLFYDGVFRSSTTISQLGPSSYTLIVGKYNDASGGETGTTAPFNGQIAEVVIWSRTITVAEIQELYRLGPGWYQPYQRKRYAFVGGVTFNRRRRILCGDYS